MLAGPPPSPTTISRIGPGAAPFAHRPLKEPAAVQNIHPLIVHFPIALVLVGVVAELLGLWAGREGARRLAGPLLTLGLLALAAAVASGFVAHRTVAHTHDVHELIEGHERAGYISLALALALVLWRRRLKLEAQGQRLLYSLLAAGLLATTIGGAKGGGELVFEHGIGTALTAHLGSPFDDPEHDHEAGHDDEPLAVDVAPPPSGTAPAQIIINSEGDMADEVCHVMNGNQIMGRCSPADIARLVAQIRGEPAPADAPAGPAATPDTPGAAATEAADHDHDDHSHVAGATASPQP